MKNLQNLEIINISTKEGKLVALVSYQDNDLKSFGTYLEDEFEQNGQ